MNQSTSSKLKRSKSPKQSIPLIRSEGFDLIDKKTPETVKVPFECPKCYWIIRSEKPDDKHPIPSVVKPLEISKNTAVAIQNCVCRNPRCKASFAVYWSDPRDFFKRV
jgi:rubredoxin